MQKVKQAKQCLVDGCVTKHHAKGYCSKHYAQIVRTGEVYRTTHDRNDVDIKEDYAEITLRNINQDVVGVAICDTDKVASLSKHKWCVHSGYAFSMIDGKGTFMHQIVLNPSEITDHINLNKLDNRIANLRPCTRGQNNYNRDKYSNNQSGYKGITYNKAKDKYQARISANGVKVSLGYFNNKVEAANAYDLAAPKYHGEFAYLNCAETA